MSAGVNLAANDSDVAAADEPTVVAAVERARLASQWWRSLGVKDRARVLLRYRDRLIDRLDEVVAVVQQETHKPRFDIVNEIAQCCDLIGYFAKHGPRFLKSRRVRPHLLKHKRASIHYRPLGVVAIITPWNYPVVLVVSPVVQALLAGNAVVLKPSEYASQTARLLWGIFTELELAEPIWQLVQGGAETARCLAGARVDKIAFTGGREGGRAILEAAAANLTPVLLELGGNDAMIVAADADLERAAAAAVWGAFLNAGQSCIAVERCYVDRTVCDKFVELVASRTRELVLGTEPGEDSDRDVGPMATQRQFDRVRELVDEAVAKGATVVTGGPSALTQELCYPPTVLTNVDRTTRLMGEETFGPVLPIVPVSNLDEGLALANDSPYGLGASVWTSNRRRARELAAQVHAGGVVINDCLIHFGITELPFGGVGQSGFGRTHGREGLLEFCATHTITEHRFGPRFEFQWFPYGTKHRWMSRFVRFWFRSGLLTRFRRPPKT